MRRIKALLALVIMLTIGISSPSSAGARDGEIEHLLQYVGNSNVMFIRNGQEHRPADALKHLVQKRNYFQGKIKSTEDFIRLCATKSLMSGDPYWVKTTDGQVEEAQRWLTAELLRYRSQSQ